MRLGILLLLANLLHGCSTGLLIVGGTLDYPARLQADTETRRRCDLDGGMRVLERVELTEQQFPTIVPTNNESLYSSRLEGIILGRYNYSETYENNPVRKAIYRHSAKITRINDGKTIAEYVYYIRAGEPGLPGIICPEGVSRSKLIDAVFFVPGEVTNPYPTCPNSETDEIQLSTDSPPVLVKAEAKINTIHNNSIRQRGYNCDGRTETSLWYEKRNGSVTLVGNRMFFFGSDGKRCQIITPEFEEFGCTKLNIFTFTYEKALDNSQTNLIVRKFTNTGQLIQKTKINNAAPRPGVMVDYRESDKTISIDTALYEDKDKADCYTASVSKPKDKKISAGPYEDIFSYHECSTKTAKYRLPTSN